jgi:hypothetical protein
VFDARPRTADVVAEAELKCLAISRDVVREVIESHPLVAREMLASMAGTIRGHCSGLPSADLPMRDSGISATMLGTDRGTRRGWVEMRPRRAVRTPWMRLSGGSAICMGVAMLLTISSSGASARTSKGELWVATYNGPRSGEDVPTAMAASRDGATVFVIGTSRAGGNSSGNFATIAYDAATGGEVWTRIYNPPVHLEDNGRAIEASPTEDVVFVTGGSRPRSTPRMTSPPSRTTP